MIEKIISGGQTGVDRAALDVAIDLNLPYGGWCPNGRLDENGVIPNKYHGLIEITGFFDQEKDNYDARTKLNIRDSDGTLILVPSLPLEAKIKDGTLLTMSEVSAKNKPFLVVDLSKSVEDNLHDLLTWMEENSSIRTINIAGPRESNSPGIYSASYHLLSELFIRLDLRPSCAL